MKFIPSVLSIFLFLADTAIMTNGVSATSNNIFDDTSNSYVSHKTEVAGLSTVDDAVISNNVFYDFKKLKNFVASVPTSELEYLPNDPNSLSIEEDHPHFLITITKEDDGSSYVSNRSLRGLQDSQTVPYDVNIENLEAIWLGLRIALVILWLRLIYQLTLVIRDLIRAKASVAWPTSLGKVLSSSVVQERDKQTGCFRIYHYLAEVVYEFNVNNTTFSGKRISYKANPNEIHRKPSLAQEIVNCYPQDKNVTVYYMPNNPKECTLEVGVKGQAFKLLLAILLIFLIIGLTIYYAYNVVNTVLLW
jgi:hypothetical protein